MRWYMYYTRPLSLPIQDPGEEMFVLTERSLPSAWSMMDTIFQSVQDTASSESWWILVYELDSSITSSYSTSAGVYDYGSGNELLFIDDAKSVNLLSWSEVIWFLDYKLEQIDDMIRQYDIVVPEWSDYSAAIPSWQGVQSLVRLSSLYAYNSCITDRIDQCRNIYDILFRFSQKMKDGWTLVQTLIGTVLENIVLHHIKYLIAQDSTTYDVLGIMLANNDYVWAERTRQHTIKTEYWIFKNMMHNLDSNFPTLDMLDIYYANEWTVWDIMDKWMYNITIVVLPKFLLLDTEQTYIMVRYFYQQGILIDQSQEDIVVRDYWTGPLWSRPNMIGRTILEAVTPRLTWLHTRLKLQEEVYNDIVKW